MILLKIKETGEIKTMDFIHDYESEIDEFISPGIHSNQFRALDEDEFVEIDGESREIDYIIDQVDYNWWVDRLNTQESINKMFNFLMSSFEEGEIGEDDFDEINDFSRIRTEYQEHDQYNLKDDLDKTYNFLNQKIAELKLIDEFSKSCL